jgi:membrane protease YdiL (CAAX protease family)
MTNPIIDNSAPAPAGSEAPALPWSPDDAWIGVGLLVVIQFAFAAAILIFKPLKIYGTYIVVILELIYLVPVVIILSLRHAQFKLLGYRRFDPRFIVAGIGLLVPAYMITIINNSLFLTFGKNIQANEILQLLKTLSSPYSFIFTGVIIAPFVEESFFRGFLFAGFRGRYGWNKAALLSSAIFAAAHLQPSVLVPTFVLGYVFSYLYQKSNSILPGMLMHFLVNAFGLFTIFVLTRAGVPIPR